MVCTVRRRCFEGSCFDSAINRLGELRSDDVPRVLDAILAQPIRPFGPQNYPIVPDHWRGRMGLGKDEQISLFESYASENNA